MSSFSTIVKKLKLSSIRTKLILGVAAVHLLLMTIFVFDLVLRQKNFLKKQNREQANNFVNDFAVNSTQYIIANDPDQLQRFILYHTNFPNLQYAMILSPDGIVMAHTNPGLVGKKLTDSISQQLTHLTTSKILVENNHIMDLVVPITANKKIVGWARAGVAQEFIQEGLTAIVRDGIFYIVIAVFIGTLFALAIGNRLTKGLRKLIFISKRIRNGDHNVRVPDFSTIELSDLGIALNQMLDEVTANEKLLSLVIEKMPIAVWIYDKEGVIISGNTAGAQIWEGSKYAGKKTFSNYKAWFTETGKLIKPEQWATVRAIQKGETTINEEIEIETIRGNRKFLLNSAFPLMGKGNEITGAIAVNVDITERKETMERLALSESTFRSAFDYSAIGMALVSPAGKILEANKQLCKMLGYGENDILPLSFQDITHPDDREEGLRKQKQALKGQSDFFQMEKRYVKKDGSIISAHVSISMVRDSQNKPLFAVAQIEDVTERKKTVEQLALSESTFRNAFDYSAIGMTLVSTEGKFLRVNKSLCRMVGYPEQELLSLTFQDITYPDDLEADLAFLHQALEGKIDSYRMDKRYIRKDRTIIWVQLSVSLVRDNHQKPLFFISQIEDISERKKAEVLEKEMNKAVADAQENERQQISMELHDNVKQIMAGCLLHMDLIKMYVKDEKVSPIINKVRDYIRETIEELRRISHQLAPSIDLSVPLEEKIKTVVNTMNVTNAVEVYYDFNIKDMALKAEVQLTLYRIVQEQFANILKHANASFVEIMVKNCDSDITMTITDNGIGFDYRTAKNGIGLENIKRRVQALNGDFSIQTKPDSGCRLFIRLQV